MSVSESRCLRLLQEVQRVPENGITQFNSEAFRQVIQNVQEHNQAMRTIYQNLLNQGDQQEVNWDEYPQHASASIVHHSIITNSKQALCIYTNSRINTLKLLQWNHRKPPQDISQEFRGKMSPEECDFCTSYKGALDQYMDQVGLDLTLQLEPPKTSLLEVRGKTKYGAWMSEQGTFHITEGSTHLMQVEDAEQLIRDNIVSPLNQSKRTKRKR